MKVLLDENLPHQAQEWSIIAPHVGTIVAAIEAALPGSFEVVECGEFRR
jgi:hypothetical protein